ncbi:hypothetical protein PR048_014006 [Dryococelus australis]|uniref:Uncharacterized protein n=1 Tax=Dryococelus australis TaxID=614101 RepID=A0ABQ9HTS7_9NEOP|nr:hypothetical protein PR048_014006 [Dryococelus australis]
MSCHLKIIVHVSFRRFQTSTIQPLGKKNEDIASGDPRARDVTFVRADTHQWKARFRDTRSTQEYSSKMAASLASNTAGLRCSINALSQPMWKGSSQCYHLTKPRSYDRYGYVRARKGLWTFTCLSHREMTTTTCIEVFRCPRIFRNNPDEEHVWTFNIRSLVYSSCGRFSLKHLHTVRDFRLQIYATINYEHVIQSSTGTDIIYTVRRHDGNTARLARRSDEALGVLVSVAPRGRSGVVARLLASHLGEPGLNPGGVTSGFSHVGIVPGDVADGRVFSGISRFPRPFIPALLHTHLVSPSSALKTSSFRAAQISPLPSTSIAVDFNDLQARLYSLMYTYADINCILVVCCHNGRRRLDTVLQEVSNTRLVGTGKIREFISGQDGFKSRADLQGNKKLITNCQVWCNTGATANEQTLKAVTGYAVVSDIRSIFLTNLRSDSESVMGTAVAKRLDCSPPPTATGLNPIPGSLQEFRKWKSCRMIAAVSGFARGSPTSPAIAFRPYSILTSLHPHRLSRRCCKYEQLKFTIIILLIEIHQYATERVAGPRGAGRVATPPSRAARATPLCRLATPLAANVAPQLYGAGLEKIRIIWNDIYSELGQDGLICRAKQRLEDYGTWFGIAVCD